MAFFETLALLRPRVGNISLAQPSPPFTCTHPSQLPTLTHTLSTKSSNLNTLALFWTLNSLCTSLLLNLYDVLLRVKQLLTRSDMTRTLLSLPQHKT